MALNSSGKRWILGIVFALEKDQQWSFQNTQKTLFIYSVEELVNTSQFTLC